MAKKKRRVGCAVALCVVFAFLICIAVLAVRQSDNIKALFYMQKYTAEQRQELKNQNDEAVHKILESVPGARVKPLTEEQEEKFINGELSEEDALKIIMGESTDAEELTIDSSETAAESGSGVGSSASNSSGTETAGAQSSENSGDSSESNQEDNAQLKKLFARVYLLRSSFTGRLNGLIDQAKAEILSPEGKGNALTIANKYYSMGTSLESECDAKMESLLAEIKSELIRTGGDAGIADEIRSTYENEKSIMKSSLMDKYIN